MKRATIIVIALVAVGISAGVYYCAAAARKPQISDGAGDRGDIVDTVGATGTLEAVTTVQVGTQVSGTVQELYADFNSIVRKGQVIARLDPSLFQTQIEQQAAPTWRGPKRTWSGFGCRSMTPASSSTRARELVGREPDPEDGARSGRGRVRSTEAQLRSAQARNDAGAREAQPDAASIWTTRSSTRRSTASSSPATWTSARPSPPACRRRRCICLPRT